jgi:NAD(P)-dependent dehydrogenase (short-subunit alcohol dehydrogenase family)
MPPHATSPRKWPASDIPPLTGKLVVVTGATGGVGFEIALALAQGCADVIVAARNESKGREAAAKIRTLAPSSLVRLEKLDLAEQASVAAFARRMIRAGRPLDMLVNNAGVMALPKRQVTADGFEMQFATNYLGHFALTGLLLPLLRESRSPRVVQVSSLAHRLGKIRQSARRAPIRGMGGLLSVQAGVAPVCPGAAEAQQWAGMGIAEQRGASGIFADGIVRQWAGRREPAFPAEPIAGQAGQPIGRRGRPTRLVRRGLRERRSGTFLRPRRTL